jgi:hypothetical protein
MNRWECLANLIMLGVIMFTVNFNSIVEFGKTLIGG